MVGQLCEKMKEKEKSAYLAFPDIMKTCDTVNGRCFIRVTAVRSSVEAYDVRLFFKQ